MSKAAYKVSTVLQKLVLFDVTIVIMKSLNYLKLERKVLIFKISLKWFHMKISIHCYPRFIY